MEDGTEHPGFRQLDDTTYQCVVCGTKTVVFTGARPDDCLACDDIIRRRTTEVPSPDDPDKPSAG